MAVEPVTTEAAVGDSISVADLQAECETILRAIGAEGGSRDDAVAHAPGAAQNADTTPRGWLRYYQQLHRMHAVLVGHGGKGTPTADRGQLDSALAAALAEEPLALPFVDGTVRYVYPKSYHALAWLDSLDRQVRANVQAAAGCADLAGAEDLQAFALAPLVNALAVRLWLWILTTRGPGLPFNETAVKVDPPKWTKDVAPEDLLRVFEAHVKIHQRRLSIIADAFPSEHAGSQSRIPLAGFIGAMAHESGQDARLLMRFHSLGKLFASAVSAAEGTREARRQSERKPSSE